MSSARTPTILRCHFCHAAGAFQLEKALVSPNARNLSATSQTTLAEQERSMLPQLL
jgi:hypothetical protein